MKQKSVAVIGGGISGIAVAHYLREKGIRVQIIEAEDRLGGRMATASLRGRGIALGGKNIGVKYSLFREFTKSMGDHPFEYFGLNSSRIRNGKIVTFDEKRRWRGMLEFAKSFSLRDLVRMIPMIRAIKADRSKDGYLGSPFFQSWQRKTKDPKLASIFHKNLVEQFIRPMTVRMNGAEPAEASVGNFGSNLSVAFDTYEQLSNGLDPLFERFSSLVPVRLNTSLESLIVRDGRVVGIKVLQEKRLEDLYFDHVILTTPASVSASLLRSNFPELSGTLEQVRYFPVAVVVAEYAKPVFNEKVRALVFPPDKPLSNAGVYGVNDRHIVRYTFSGKSAREILSSRPSLEDLVALGERTLSEFIPFGENPRISFTGKVMKLGLCAYAFDYERFRRDFDFQSSAIQGLELTGDYLRGASIEACFRAAKECVDGLKISDTRIQSGKEEETALAASY
ncbi:FAD-dependent oxidoreductase [Leptospira fletcheri]|uniref:FAD-dependent oxidoreductase n=1 Tax=Leptospira fletcheri TaxID=2484981 RepID=A0A4R9G4H1_9LEPT|nr:FAD-dependent oxidoreductase [Leptospira fletcheri]TGK06416.1 FAD-dependent oxidoreductase [Leptospira fletcheri]